MHSKGKCGQTQGERESHVRMSPFWTFVLLGDRAQKCGTDETSLSAPRKWGAQFPALSSFHGVSRTAMASGV